METLLILFFMLLLSGFFSGSETALTALSHSRVEALLHEDRSGARALHALKSNTDRMLITLLIGNNLVNIGASAIATVLATQLFGDMGPGLAVGGLTLFILIFGEIVPKTFAARNMVTIGLIVAPPLFLFAKLVFPLTWLLEHITQSMERFSNANEPMVTESELLSMARHGAREGAIEADEEAMIKRVFELNDLCAEDIMVPRAQMVTADGDLTVTEAAKSLLAQPYGRVPLTLGDSDEIQGVIYVRDVLEAMVHEDGQKKLREIAHEPIYIAQNQRLDDLLERMRGRKEKMAVVVDDMGMAQGLFTLEDILEEVVGEIYDESEGPEHTAVVENQPGEVQVDGITEMRHVIAYFKMDLKSKPTDRVNQWLLANIARIPMPGECFNIGDLEVEVKRASRRRIHKVLVRKPGVASTVDG
ncbi:hemolysin family protein [Magnetococcus sp. PR-3]|uniref:hemolysin family protein n=1 Tax=Magnetococcus sp. PR-3 TaxID=3120355 RepID=UPI002FCE33C3